jgi:hypothetical protein
VPRRVGLVKAKGGEIVKTKLLILLAMLMLMLAVAAPAFAQPPLSSNGACILEAKAAFGAKDAHFFCGKRRV